jgi:hypothetical protein
MSAGLLRAQAGALRDATATAPDWMVIENLLNAPIQISTGLYTIDSA